jgi:hypothetical protein
LNNNKKILTITREDPKGIEYELKKNWTTMQKELNNNLRKTKKPCKNIQKH